MTPKKKLRIGLFTDDYEPYVHGVVSSINSYKQALESMGHEVYVVAPKVPKYLDNHKNIVRVRSVNSLVFDRRSIALLYPGMERKLRKYNFDIVHSHTPFYMGVLAKMVADHQSVPHVSTMHTVFSEIIDNYPLVTRSALFAITIGYPVALKSKPFIKVPTKPADFVLLKKKYLHEQYWGMMNMFYSKVDLLISPSEHLGKAVIENGLKVSLEILPNGIETKKFGRKKTDKLTITKGRGDIWLASVSRMSEEKRPAILLEAMSYVTNPRVKLIMVGDGPSLSRLKLLSRNLGIDNRVIFLGNQDSESVRAILANSDIFSLASYRFDNQPVVILEAIASGLPIIYCDDNLTEGLNSSNSILTADTKPINFANSIDILALDHKLRKKMGNSSKDISKEFEIKVLAKRLEQIYFSLLLG